MNILTIRTDKPDAEIGLYSDQKQIAYEIWSAHRQLAENLHTKIQELLAANNFALADLQAVAVHKGPGSFTGLRIGISVANALAVALAVPIIGDVENNLQDWRITCIEKLLEGDDDKVVVPEYGAPVHITLPKT